MSAVRAGQVGRLWRRAGDPPMRKTLVAVTLAAALAAARPALLDQLWTLFTSIWSEASPDEGCGFDPNGLCIPAPRAEEGCGGDPDGRCNPAPQPEEGCGMDPDGCPQGS
jgi:hypothetical protein